MGRTYQSIKEISAQQITFLLANRSIHAQAFSFSEDMVLTQLGSPNNEAQRLCVRWVALFTYSAAVAQQTE